jgi:putative oxidoreductase
VCVSPLRIFGSNRASFDCILLLLRLALGIVMFPHGAQKLLGWYGGFGFQGTMHFFTEVMHIPAFLALLAILAEFIGSLCVITGALTRLAALAITTNMLVAVFTIHLHNGFFMNWSGHQKGEGIEYFIYAIAVGLVLITAGAGKFSIDAVIAAEAKAKYIYRT